MTVFQPCNPEIQGIRYRMRTLILIALAAVMFTGHAVELKAGQDLPYVRLTVSMPDGSTRTDDGWWDKDLHVLFHEKADNFGGTYPDNRIVKIAPASNPQAVKKMPDYIRGAITEKLAEQKAKQQAP